jgi:DNA-binding XRE family transcriptional regulator
MKQTKPYQNLRVDRNSIINLEKGKIPPQAIDLE